MEHAAWSELEEAPDDGRGDDSESVLLDKLRERNNRTV